MRMGLGVPARPRRPPERWPLRCELKLPVLQGALLALSAAVQEVPGGALVSEAAPSLLPGSSEPAGRFPRPFPRASAPRVPRGAL